LINLQDVLNEWEEDSKIDQRDLSQATIESAKLHAKYLKQYSLAKLQLKKSEMDQKTLLRDKWEWYNGKMDKETIEKNGWSYDPLNGLKILKGDMDKYYDADPDIQKSEEKIEYWKTVVLALKEILESVKWRAQSIKNIIEWKKFEAGA